MWLLMVLERSIQVWPRTQSNTCQLHRHVDDQLLQYACIHRGDQRTADSYHEQTTKNKKDRKRDDLFLYINSTIIPLLNL